MATLSDVVRAALSDFGQAATPRLQGPGEPEDQMRAPLERLLAEVAQAAGLEFVPHGESTLASMGVRPDYAIEVDRAICGYVEVKAPGKGADPTAWPPAGHDRRQWERLKALPNLLYTDGNQWALYRSGVREGDVAHVVGDVRHSGDQLRPADERLVSLLVSFLRWAPTPPGTADALAQAVAGLCRLLRDEVTEALAREQRLTDGGTPFSAIAEEWRDLLFPDADDATFADSYAQTITFALLLARAERIPLDDADVRRVADALGAEHGLLGRALRVLTDDQARAHIRTSLGALMRVIAVVDWSLLDGTGTRLPGLAQPDLGVAGSPWLHFYEDFLAAYDPELRKRAGAYYTPHGVVGPQVRLVEEVLRERLGVSEGMADPRVTIIDPAMGTGSYLIEIVDRVAAEAALHQGAGAVAGALQELTSRLIGFEIMAGPFAVSEMLVREALRRRGSDGRGARLLLADTLADPEGDELRVPTFYEPISRSRREADRIKRTERVLVCLGNPPYDRHDSASHLGGWVRHRVEGRALLEDFRSDDPAISAFQVNLFNLYVYFWRWGLWKVFEAHEDAPTGVVAFITASSFTTGPGYGAMREHMRRVADEGWVIDLTPEGHQPPVSTRPFPGVQQPISIAIFVRGATPDRTRPAPIHYIALTGRRREKFAALGALGLNDPGWAVCPQAWSAPFRPASGDVWISYPALTDLFPWGSPGVKAERTWPIAPAKEVLAERWRHLLQAPDADERSARLEANHDRSVHSTPMPLPGPGTAGGRMPALASLPADAPLPAVVRLGYRSFDRQWLIADGRLIGRPRPPLWRVLGPRQLFLTTTDKQEIRGGPAVTLTAHIPDNHHYRGAFAGVALPLWRDAAGTEPNLLPGLLDRLASTFGQPVEPEDLVAYVAALLAHAGYTRRFREELRNPGPRVPVTTDPALFARAVALGRRVIGLHTFGERPAGAAMHPQGQARVTAPIPSTAEGMPAAVSWAAGELSVGEGRISPVPAAVWSYEVSTMRVVPHWLEYRLREPAGIGTGPLDRIVARRWPHEWTRELLELLWVLEGLVDMEPEQESVLEQIVNGPLLSAGQLTEAGLIPLPARARRAPGVQSGRGPGRQESLVPDSG